MTAPLYCCAESGKDWQHIPKTEKRVKSGEREIGPHIQSLRKARQLTLDDLARKSGVSRSMLSQIERGKANPTIATVWALADAFGLPISDLVVHPQPPSPIELLSSAQTPEMRSDDGLCAIRVLSPHDSVGRLEWYELRVQPRGVLASEPHAAGCREHLTVLEGKLAVHTDGRSETVEAGETARYRVDVAHRIENPGPDVARALLIVAF
ncbi:MAG TPA: XRE family transcriptional regulator [Sphingomonas sp.]|nr:XRE family transcriptional regulator [Sphingomonas sp.]